MQAMNCLIVEDEPLAATVIADYIRQVPGLHLVDICESAEEAGSRIYQYKIDLIFLDINLPGLSGMDFIKTLKSSTQVILITAYHEHALEAFRLNVTDYLLKPVDISAFLQAADKALERYKYMQSYPMHKIFYVISERKKIKVKTEDVIYIESMKDNMKIHTTEKDVITKMSITDMEEQLSGLKFLRIHKSFIINTEKISAYSSSIIELGSNTLPIGRTYMEQVMEVLQQQSR